MMTFLFFIIIFFLLLLVFVPVVFISFIRSLVSVFTRKRKQNVKENRDSYSNDSWTHEPNANTQRSNRNKGKKIFDKSEGEYVSFEEVKD